jgi:hypothetical protein
MLGRSSLLRACFRMSNFCRRDFGSDLLLG